MRTVFSLCILVWFLTSCTTSPVGSGDFTDRGVWTGKVQMTNKTTNFKKWANVTWASDSSKDRMRVDVSAIMDVPIASFIKTEDGYHLWLYTEGAYYFSENGEKLFQHLTKLSVDPNIFYNMLGRPKSPGRDWKCLPKPSVLRCKSGLNKTQFSVKHEDPDQRTIYVEKGSKALRVKLSRSKVEVTEEMFRKLSTSQFRTYRL